jgi:hypothetical protein
MCAYCACDWTVQAGREDGFDSWRSESWVDQKADARRPYGDSTNDRQNNERARKSDVERSQFDLKLSPLRSEQDHRPGRRSYDEREGRREERVVNEGVRGHWRRPDNSSQSSFPPPIRSGKASLGEDSPSVRVEQPQSNGGSQTSGLHLTSPVSFKFFLAGIYCTLEIFQLDSYCSDILLVFLEMKYRRFV